MILSLPSEAFHKRVKFCWHALRVKQLFRGSLSNMSAIYENSLRLFLQSKPMEIIQLALCEFFVLINKLVRIMKKP